MCFLASLHEIFLPFSTGEKGILKSLGVRSKVASWLGYPFLGQSNSFFVFV